MSTVLSRNLMAQLTIQMMCHSRTCWPGRRCRPGCCDGHCQFVPFVMPMGMRIGPPGVDTSSTYMPLKGVVDAVTVNSIVSPGQNCRGHARLPGHPRSHRYQVLEETALPSHWLNPLSSHDH